MQEHAILLGMKLHVTSQNPPLWTRLDFTLTVHVSLKLNSVFNILLVFHLNCLNLCIDKQRCKPKLKLTLHFLS